MKKINRIDVKIKNISNLSSRDGEYLQVDDEGRAFITGSSVTGAIRQYIKMNGSEALEKQCFDEHTIFISDLHTDKDVEIVERTSTKINEFGTAEDKHLHSRLSISSGHVFSFTIKLFDCDDDCRRAVINALDGFDYGLIQLGSYTSVGYGKMKILEKKERIFNLENKSDLHDYIYDIKAEKEIVKIDVDSVANNSIIIEMTGTFENDILVVGDKPLDHKQADVVALKDGADYIIPGSSLKGVFRNQLAILDDYNNTKLLDEIVGTNDQASRLVFEDSKIRDFKQCKYDKIRIDYITGGIITGAKAVSETVNGEVTFRILISNREKIDNKKLKYILMTVRDFSNSRVTIGSSFASGKGHFRASKIEVTDPKILNNIKHTVDFSNFSDKYLSCVLEEGASNG